MNEPRKEWSLPLTYWQQRVRLYHLLRSIRRLVGTPYCLAKSLDTFRGARWRFAWDKGTFLLTSPWSNMATPGGVE
jgi:hypothetical protein